MPFVTIETPHGPVDIELTAEDWQRVLRGDALDFAKYIDENGDARTPPVEGQP